MSKRELAINILIEERIMTAEMNADVSRSYWGALAEKLQSTLLHRLLADMIWEG